MTGQSHVNQIDFPGMTPHTDWMSKQVHFPTNLFVFFSGAVTGCLIAFLVLSPPGVDEGARNGLARLEAQQKQIVGLMIQKHPEIAGKPEEER